jgi:hypothetical protein
MDFEDEMSFQLDAEYWDDLRPNSELGREATLIYAIFQQLISDIRCPKPARRRSGLLPTIGEQLSALEWLVDGRELADVAGLLDLDGAWLREQLLALVGLSDATPRLGERREPLPSTPPAPSPVPHNPPRRKRVTWQA